MKSIIIFLKNWFENNGLIKLLATFLIFIISIIVGRNVSSLEIAMTWIAKISGAYLLLTALVFAIMGVINQFKDWFKKK